MPGHVRYDGGIIHHDNSPPYGVPMPDYEEFRDDVKDWFYLHGIRPVIVVFTVPREDIPPYVVDGDPYPFYERHFHLWFADENLAFEFKMRFG